MQILKNNALRNLIRLICSIAIIAMVYVAVSVYHASMAGLAVFLLFFVFYVQLPGAFINQILRIPTDHISSHLLISLFAGWSLVVAEFFISDLLRSDLLLYALGPFLSIVYIVKSFKKSEYRNTLKTISPTKIPAALYVAVTLILLYVMLRTQYQYMDPDYSASIWISTDKAYQMGLINSLSHDYPIANPWISGRLIHYHIFSQILYCVPVRLFGLTSDFLILSCGPYLLTYTLSLAYYSMFREFCRIKERAGMYTLSIILSNMFIAKSITSSYTFQILFRNDNYGGYGVAAAVAWVILLKVSLDKAKNGKNNYGSFILLVALMMLTTGIKAPIGLILTGGVIGTWILGLILHKVNIKSAVPLAIITLAFLFIYKIILASGGSSSGDGESSIFGFAKLNNLCFWKDDLIATMTANAISPFIRLCIIMLLFMLCFLTAFLIPFCIGYIRELVLVLRKKKPFDFARITVYAVSLVGLVLSLIMKYNGHSQIYFALILTAFAPLITFWFWEDIELGDSACWMKVLYKISLVTFFIIITFTSATLFADNAKALNKATKEADVNTIHNIYRSISADEYDAMLWLKENTDEDALIATHMHANAGPSAYTLQNRWVNCHFMYADYSDRSFYIEGSGFSLDDDEWTVRRDMIAENAKLYDPANEDVGAIAERLGVDYVVLTKSMIGDIDMSSEDYKLCYSNDSVDIYQVVS